MMNFRAVEFVFAISLITIWIHSAHVLALDDEGYFNTNTREDNQKSCEAPIVPSPLHKGVCPEPDPGIRCIWCNDSCTRDTDCSASEKCCVQPGCGNWCKKAVVGNNVIVG